MSVVLLESEDVAWFRDNLTGARLAASRLAVRVGLGEHRAGEVALAISEASSNLVKHATDGAIVLRVVRTADQAGVEFLSVDRGPGITDVAASMRDGRSTAGTLGIGLGMIARLADIFDLHSLPGQGTVMLARFWPREASFSHPGIRAELPDSVVGGVTRPISGAAESGDGWAARWDDARPPAPAPHLCDAVAGTPADAPDQAAPSHDRPSAGPASAAISAGRAVLLMLSDGLGHGPLAKIATQTAIRAFRDSRNGSPDEIMQEIHQALAGTRGAAVAVAHVEPDRERVLFCAVGDISGAILTSGSKTSLPSTPGTAGHQIRTPHISTHPLPAGSALILHSDGLTGRWNPETLPGILHHSPTVIAGHLLRTAGKHHDDASAVVTKSWW